MEITDASWGEFETAVGAFPCPDADKTELLAKVSQLMSLKDKKD